MSLSTAERPSSVQDALGNDFDPDTGIYLPGQDPEILSHLTENERRIFSRRTRKLLQVTDVGDGPQDFDAHETILARHLQLEDNRIYSIGNDSRVLKYAADFTTDIPAMTEDVLIRAIQQARESGRNLPADVVGAMRTLEETTLRILLNSAPRNQNATERKNGRDFHLGITENGAEVYAVPKWALQYIRHKLTALFRVPTDGHPLTEDGEQFRSSLFGQTAHSAPEHLELLWRRGQHAPEDLDGHIPPVHGEEVAFIDAPFRNRRIYSPDINRFLEQLDENIQCSDHTVLLQIGSTRVRAYRTGNLASIPGGKWGVYANVADTRANGSGYIEVNKRLPDGGSIEDPALRSDTDLQEEDRGIGAAVRVLPGQ